MKKNLLALGLLLSPLLHSATANAASISFYPRGGAVIATVDNSIAPGYLAVIPTNNGVATRLAFLTTPITCDAGYFVTGKSFGNLSAVVVYSLDFCGSTNLDNLSK